MLKQLRTLALNELWVDSGPKPNQRLESWHAVVLATHP